MIKHNIHPGQFLKELLEEMAISAYRLHIDTGMPRSRISQIIKGKRGISADTAVRLSRYFGTTSQYWMNLQMSFDLSIAEESITEKIKSVA